MTSGSGLIGGYCSKVQVFSFALFLAHTHLNSKTHTHSHTVGRQLPFYLIAACTCSLVTGSMSPWLAGDHGKPINT